MHPRNDLILAATRKLALSILVLIAAAVAIYMYGGAQGALPVWVVVMTFGMAGGYISIQRRLKVMPEDDIVLLAKSWLHTLLPPLAGGILATILYVLFISEIMKGHLFPGFKYEESTATGFSRLTAVEADKPQDYAKLIFWSFIAGYSESFVTNIVGRFASTAQNDVDHPNRSG